MQSREGAAHARTKDGIKVDRMHAGSNLDKIGRESG